MLLNIEKGYINGLPFKGLKKKSDLFSFDYTPVLSHYYDDNNNDYLFYWIDFFQNKNRWLCIRISKESLFHYLNDGATLRELVYDMQYNPYLFLVNQNEKGDFIDGFLITANEIPEDYMPDEDSFFGYAFPELYQTYLEEYSFVNKLKEKAYIFNLRPTDRIHETILSSDLAAKFLSAITQTGKEYVGYKAYGWFKDKIPSQAKLVAFINKLKERYTFRVPILKVASFEIGLAIDTASILTEEYKLDFDWKNELVEGFQRDVLAVNYSDIEVAKKLAEMYDEDTRKKIFSPFMRIIANEKINMTVTNYDNTFRKDYSFKRIKNDFRKIVVPRFEEEEEVIEKKFKLHHLVIALEEGKDFKDIKTIKEITQGLLYGEEQDDASYAVHSPVVYNGQA